MKKNYIFILIILLCFFTLNITQADSLVKYVAKIRNEAPRARYLQPTAEQIRLLQLAAKSILHKDFSRATHDANVCGYTVRLITNTVGGTTSNYYVLESLSPKYRAWGTYIFYLASDGYNYAIEVPCPLEVNTSMIGIKGFINSKSKIFLMGGTHKKKFNPTITPGSVFQAIHEEMSYYLLGYIQVREFNVRSYPQIVLTSGTPITNSTMSLLEFGLFLQGFDVDVYDGIHYPMVSATDNLQAIFTSGQGNDFVGLFLNQMTASSKKRSTKVIDAIESTTSESQEY